MDSIAFRPGMNNEDFRKLLQHPRVAPAAVTEGQNEREEETNDHAGAEHEQRVPRTNKALEEINAKYVDRAELRRKGLDDLGEDPVEVKGLDFALVAKARAERARVALAATGQDAKDQRYCDAMRAGHASDSSRASPSGRSNQGRHLARAIEAALLEMTKAAPSHLGASLASTSYVYVTELDRYEVPVIRKRALKGMAETSSEEADRAAAARRPLPKAVIGEICAIMRYCGESKGGKWRNGVNGVNGENEENGASGADGGMGGATADEGQESPSDGALAGTIGKPHVVPLQTINEDDDNIGDSDEDDIFGDAGTDYVPTAKKEPDASAAKPSTYFSESTVPSIAGGGNMSEDEDDGKNTGVGIADEGRRGGPFRAKRMAVQSDGYDECYPDYDGVDVASDVDEEPEEQTPAVMTKKARKMADKKEQARLEGELSSIQKIFEDKAWKGLGDKPPQNAMPKKKRRI